MLAGERAVPQLAALGGAVAGPQPPAQLIGPTMVATEGYKLTSGQG